MSQFAMEFERPLVELEQKLATLRRVVVSGDSELAAEVEALVAQVDELRNGLYENITPWQRVQIARHPDRPKTQDYLAALFEDVFELRGDRAFGDDEAIVAALATFGGRRVAVVGHRKGKDTKENVRRHFGSPHPEGYRKAMRVMRLAEKFGLPVVTFVDTQGAYPGVDAEQRGQAWAIAESIALLSGLRVPVVCVGIGEGGSGGALAIGFGDRLIMLENSYYSVASPEASASILYKDAAYAPQAAASLRLIANDLVQLGIADEIVQEPRGGAHRDPVAVFEGVRSSIERALDVLCATDAVSLIENRYRRVRSIGEFLE